MEKLGMWLIVLIAVVFLARPQSSNVTQNTEIVASAECVDEESNSGSIILTVVIILIIIGAISDACGSEEIDEN
ncbi:MAG: hypothetical protein NC299_18120 [Lachnospiraceae bacterium]|nr:hypothetical protein [Lachnospiraceae bacterium]